MLNDLRLALMACLMALAIEGPAFAQAPSFSITLTGQSMIRSDIREYAPAAVPVISSLLKGDVKFTNFEFHHLRGAQRAIAKRGPFLVGARSARCAENLWLQFAVLGQ